jgi:hypothetical protein
VGTGFYRDSLRYKTRASKELENLNVRETPMNIAEKISKDTTSDADKSQQSKDSYLDELSFLNKRPCWQAASEQK